MAIFEIQGPDGSVYEIDAPDQSAAIAGFQRFSQSRSPAPEAPGMVSSAVRGAAQGLTLGAGDEGSALAAASPIPGAERRSRVLPLPDPIDMIAGGGRMLLEKAGILGQGAGEAYDRGLDQKRADNREHQKANPISYGAGEVVGSAVPVIAAATAAPGAFGITGRNLLTRSIASAGSGAGVGAVQGFNSGEGGLNDRLENAKVPFVTGAGLGAISPAAGLLVGKGVGAVSDAVRARLASGTSSGAATKALAEDVAAAGGPQAVRDRLTELGPDAMLLDASPSFQGRAQGLAIQPETREMIVDPLLARNRGTNARLATDLDSAVGPAPVPSRIEADLAASRGLVSEQYPNVFEGAKAVDTSALAAKLETNAVNLRGPARAAAEKVRGYLDIPGNPGHLDPNPAALHQTRQAIDGLLDGETNRTVRWVLGEARKEVDKLLGEAAPGIKAIDAQQAELFRQSEGLKRGSQIFDGGKTAIRPQELADELSAAALPQGEMVGPSAVPLRIRQGGRGEMDRLVGTHINDLNELRKLIKGDGDWNYTKLIQVFGSKPAAKIWNAVDREAAFREAYQKISEGSMTAMRTGAAEGTKVRGQGGASAAGLPAVAGAIGGPGAAATAVGAQGARWSFNQALRAADLARNRQLAESLVLRQGPELDSLIDLLTGRLAQTGRADRDGKVAGSLVQMLMQGQGNQTGQMLDYRRSR